MDCDSSSEPSAASARNALAIVRRSFGKNLTGGDRQALARIRVGLMQSGRSELEQAVAALDQVEDRLGNLIGIERWSDRLLDALELVDTRFELLEHQPLVA